MMRLRISDRTLRRWLETGTPRRVGRRLHHDPGLERRIRSLSDLDAAQVEAIRIATAPPADLVRTTTHGVKRQLKDRGVVSTIGDFLGLGVRTAEVYLTQSDSPDTRRAESRESDDSSENLRDQG